MKTLKAVLGGYTPKSPDEAKFAGKHKIKVTDDAHGNDDKLFKASNIKPINRESPDNHGYNPGTDEKVYENWTGRARKALTHEFQKYASPYGDSEPDVPADKRKKLYSLDAKLKARDAKKTLNNHTEPSDAPVVQEWDDKTDPNSPEAHKFHLSDYTDPIKKTVKGIRKKISSITTKEETSQMRKLAPHILETVKAITEAKPVIEESVPFRMVNGRREATEGDLPLFTGTGHAPWEGMHHIVALDRTTYLGKDIGHKIIISTNAHGNPEKDYDALTKAGREVILVRPKANP